MSLQTAVRPSSLPLPKTLSSSTPSVATKGLMSVERRQRRGGSTTPPYRSILPVYQRPPEEAQAVVTAVQNRLKRPFSGTAAVASAAAANSEAKNAAIIRRHSARTSADRVSNKKLSDCGRKISDSITRKPSSCCSSDSNSSTPKPGRKTGCAATKDALKPSRKISSSSVDSNSSPNVNKKVSRTSSSAAADGRRPSISKTPSIKSSAVTKAQELRINTKALGERSGVKKPSNLANKAKDTADVKPRSAVRTARTPMNVAKNNLQNMDAPDVIRVGKHHQKTFSFLESRITTLECDLLRNQNQLDHKQAAYATLISNLEHNAKGFAAMAILVNHLSCFSSNSAEHSQKIEQNQRLTQLYQRINQKDVELARLKQYYEEVVAQLEDLSSSAISETEFNETILKLENRHNKVVEKLLIEHKFDVEHVEQNHANQMHRLQEEMLEKLEQSEMKCHSAVEDGDERWRHKLSEELAFRAQEVEATIDDWRRKEEHWEDTKKSLEETIRTLRADLKDRDEALEAKAKGDAAKTTNAKLEAIIAEADSMKAVMEIRCEENRQLRKDNIRLEEKLTDYKKTVKRLKKANLLIEDYKARLDSKMDVERKLSEENQRLCSSIERESSSKQKLIMENEELQWKIRRSLDFGVDTMSMSMIDPSSASGLDSASPMCRSFHVANCSTPLKHNISLSDPTAAGPPADGSRNPQSLPPFVGGSRSKFRPLSAPPGKLDCARFLHNRDSSPFRRKDGLIQQPDSPRVLEVVEKSDSLAWKLEYDGGSEDESSKPSPRYQSSLHLVHRGSPLLTRRSHSPDLMSKSLDPSVCWTTTAERSQAARTVKKIPEFDTVSESVVEEPPDSLEDKRESGDKEQSSDFDIGDISSSSEMDEPLMEVTTPQIEALESKILVFNSCSSSSGLSSDNNVSSPDTDDVTLKESLIPASKSNGVCRFTSTSVIKKRQQPKYHHSNSSAMASSLQGSAMFNAKCPQQSAGESLVVVVDGDGTPESLLHSYEDSF